MEIIALTNMAAATAWPPSERNTSSESCVGWKGSESARFCPLGSAQLQPSAFALVEAEGVVVRGSEGDDPFWGVARTVGKEGRRA